MQCAREAGKPPPREINDAIAHNLSLSEEERTVANKNGYPRFENQIAWARSYLVKTGYLDSPSHGVWRLTDKGKEAHLDGPDIDVIWQRVMEMNALAKAKAGGSRRLRRGAFPNPKALLRMRKMRLSRLHHKPRLIAIIEHPLLR